MLKPNMLLLDEAFSAIDPITRSAIHDQFVALRTKESVTTLMVTHDIREAVKLGSHLVIIREGAILQSGITTSVVNNPVDAYVQSLLETQL
jgi:glycine betaine/proline transport system ATP-binding protein